MWTGVLRAVSVKEGLRASNDRIFKLCLSKIVSTRARQYNMRTIEYKLSRVIIGEEQSIVNDWFSNVILYIK